jgi:hypothetical protein
MERANRLNMGTANCTGFDAEPPRSALPACMKALTGTADTPKMRVAYLRPRMAALGSPFLRVVSPIWPEVACGPVLSVLLTAYGEAGETSRAMRLALLISAIRRS